jgi:hypothetical protein
MGTIWQMMGRPWNVMLVKVDMSAYRRNKTPARPTYVNGDRSSQKKQRLWLKTGSQVLDPAESSDYKCPRQWKCSSWYKRTSHLLFRHHHRACPASCSTTNRRFPEIGDLAPADLPSTESSMASLQ